MNYPEPITRRDDALLSSLLTIWEGAVKATHHFLAEAAVLSLRPLVREGLVGIERLTVLREAGEIIAFMGTEGPMLEMLFVHPAYRGKGAGRVLVSHATQDLGVRLVDVNEQNPQAIGFYERLGFRVHTRSPLDGQGNPYPILHMKLPRDPLEAALWRVPPGGLLVRPAWPGESGLVSHLHMQVYGEQYAFLGAFEHYLLDGLAAFLRSPGAGRLWVVLEGEAAAGSIAIASGEEGAAQLRWFVLRQDLQGRGHGRALMETAMAFARQSGYERVFLWTIDMLAAARRLYTEFGFQWTAETPNTTWTGSPLIEERWEVVL